MAMAGAVSMSTNESPIGNRRHGSHIEAIGVPLVLGRGGWYTDSSTSIAKVCLSDTMVC